MIQFDKDRIKLLTATLKAQHEAAMMLTSYIPNTVPQLLKDNWNKAAEQAQALLYPNGQTPPPKL